MSRKSWKSILVAIANPHQREQAALAKAAAIAARSGARLTLFNAFMVPPPPSTASGASSAEIVRTAAVEREQRLEKLSRPLRARGIKVTHKVVWDFPAQEAIVRQVLSAKPDLVIAESSRHSRLARIVLANTDWELIRNCPCPVWFVKSQVLPKTPNVLVAVDPRHTHAKPTQLDDRLLAAARLVTEQLGGQVSIGHAFDPPLLSAPAMIIEPIRLPISPVRARQFEQHTKKMVQGLAKKHGVSTSRQFVAPGDAAHVLPELAEDLNTHLLVMGAVSRSRLRAPFIGNTAEKVIDHVDCDVLIVKPKGFKTAVPRKAAHLPKR